MTSLSQFLRTHRKQRSDVVLLEVQRVHLRVQLLHVRLHRGLRLLLILLPLGLIAGKDLLIPALELLKIDLVNLLQLHRDMRRRSRRFVAMRRGHHPAHRGGYYGPLIMLLNL